MKTKLSREEKRRLVRVIAFASLLIAGVNVAWWFAVGRPYTALLRSAEQKRYAPTPISTPAPGGQVPAQETQAAHPQDPQAASPQKPGAGDTASGAMPSRPINTDTAEKPAPAAQSQEEGAAPDPHTDHSAEDLRIQDLITEVFIRIEDAEADLERTGVLLEDGTPALAAKLKKKSVEEQLKFLRAVKDGFPNALPAELRAAMQPLLTPELMDQAWRDFLDDLAKAGYTPPEGL